MIDYRMNPADFDDWAAVHRLLHEAFAYMADRIDPPSSLHRLSVEQLEEKSKSEEFVLAFDHDRVVGCAFGKVRASSLYVGKVAVSEAARGKGVARQMLAMLEDVARDRGLARLELEIRIELVENQQAFAKLGFLKSGETAHPGYDRPTAVTMIKSLME